MFRPAANGEDGPVDHRPKWQFSLRSALVGVAACCALLGVAMWKGIGVAAGVLFVGSVLMGSFAVYRRRKRLAIGVGAFLLVQVVLIGLYRFGPRSTVKSLCLICGRERIRATFLGIEWYDRERESELSAWYREAGLREHSHHWTLFWSTEQGWGGEWAHADSFGWQLIPLELLRDASQEVDPPTFDELAEEYWAACRAGGDVPGGMAPFCDRCRRLISAEDTTQPDR
jgi:hypothetical protein